MTRLSEENMQRLRDRWAKCNSAPYEFPNDGAEARSIMRCFAELTTRVLPEMGYGGTSSQRDRIKYVICRRLANHYDTDISDLPTTLNERREVLA